MKRLPSTTTATHTRHHIFKQANVLPGNNKPICFICLCSGRLLDAFIIENDDGGKIRETENLPILFICVQQYLLCRWKSLSFCYTVKNSTNMRFFFQFSLYGFILIIHHTLHFTASSNLHIWQIFFLHIFAFHAR